MRIGELAQRSGVTVKAVRYYESLGLVDADRLPNGYRDYDESDVRLVTEIGDLVRLGVRADEARPFLECLIAGNGQGDDCPDAHAAYRGAIADLDARIAELAERRERLVGTLADAERRPPGCGLAGH